MAKRGVQPNLFTYNVALGACEKGRHWQRSLKLLEEMRKRGVQPNIFSYNPVLAACEKGRQWQKALELLEEMEKRVCFFLFFVLTLFLFWGTLFLGLFFGLFIDEFF
jgi:pentatricopeptide repeat protein